MLHIKLPKKKVASACRRVAERLSQDIGRIPANKTARACLSIDRKHFHDMTDMVMRSVGDVYVSPKLWAAIKEMY